MHDAIVQHYVTVTISGFIFVNTITAVFRRRTIAIILKKLNFSAWKSCSIEQRMGRKRPQKREFKEKRFDSASVPVM